MKYRKVIPFKLKNLLPMAVIAGSTIFFAACHKKPLPEPQHDTTYVWGKHYWTEVWPADKVVASADSSSVRNVFLMNDGISWEGSSTTLIMKQLTPIIESVPSGNRYKLRGAGTLNGVSMGNEQTYKDSITLANLGFKINKVR